jgi:peroxiredoxin
VAKARKGPDCPFAKAALANAGCKSESGGLGAKSGGCGKDGGACPDCAKGAVDAAYASGPAKMTEPFRVGQKAANFQLPQAGSDKEATLKDLAGKNGALLVFWNQGCPFVQEAAGRIDAFHQEYGKQGINVVAVDAGVNNDPKNIAAHAKGKSFPILINRNSAVAAAFGVERTPEVFLLDKNLTVQYHGAFDSGKSKTDDGQRKDYAIAAAQAVLDGKQPVVKSTQAFGCGLKYAEGVKPLGATKAKGAKDKGSMAQAAYSGSSSK